MSSTPVTVIIPLYNKAGTIRRSLDSVLAQSAGDFTVLVVDDGSTDGGAEIAEQTGDPRVRVLRQSNQGASAARNRGIEEAQTELVALLDADDEWSAGFLEAVTGLRERHPDAALWVTAYRAVTGDGQEELEFRGVPDNPDGGIIEDFIATLLKWSPVCSSNVLGRRDVFRDAGGFPVGDARAEDTDMWVRIALKHAIAFTPAVLATYRRDAPGRVSNEHRYGADSALAATLRTALSDSFGAGSSLRGSIRKVLAKHLLRLAEDCIATGQSREARRLCREAAGHGVYWDRYLKLYLQSFGASSADGARRS